jgi:hypothetical protein
VARKGAEFRSVLNTDSIAAVFTKVDAD